MSKRFKEVELELAANDMLRSLKFFHPDNSVFELVGIKTKNNSSEAWDGWIRTGAFAGGYFREHEVAAKLAYNMDISEDAESICITVNPCTEDLLSRANQRIINLQNRTKDQDIFLHNHLIIDIDPERLSHISSTDEEHNLALETAQRIAKHFADKGWAEPLIADSGNGAHVVFKIDLPNNPESKKLIDTCLKAVGHLFKDKKYKIDSSLGNAAQLLKLYGTYARKGDPTEKRPHRRSKILNYPETIQLVTREQLDALASELPQEGTERTSPPKNNPPSTATQAKEKGSNVQVKGTDKQGFDVEAYLKHYNIPLKDIKYNAGATIFVLEQCLFDPFHDQGQSSIILDSEGGLRYQCFHDSCKAYKWKDARVTISGEDNLAMFSPKMPLSTFPPKEFTQPDIFDFNTLMEKDLPPTLWVVRDLIPEGLTILSGKPKLGKSWFIYQLALAVTMGHKFLGAFPVEKTGVLGLFLEETDTRLQDRMFLMGFENATIDNFNMVTSWKKIKDGGLDDLKVYLLNNPQIKMVIIDTFGIFNAGKTSGSNLYQFEYDTFSYIKSFADELKIALVVVHHDRKALNEKNLLDQVSGSTGITGAADTVLKLDKKSHDSPEGTLYITGRSVINATYRIEFQEDECKWKFVGNEKEFTISAQQKEIWEVIKKMNRDFTYNEIKNEFDNTINLSSLKSALKRLRKKNLLKFDGKIYKIVNSINAETDIEDTPPPPKFIQPDIFEGITGIDS